MQVTVSRDSRLVAAADAAAPLVVQQSGPAAAAGPTAGFDWAHFSRTASDAVCVA